MRTITIEEVKAAYQRNGFKPMAGRIDPTPSFGPNDPHCCALGALSDGKAKKTDEGAELAGVDVDFAFGFDDGFTGNAVDVDYTPVHPQYLPYLNGYEIGAAIRKEGI